MPESVRTLCYITHRHRAAFEAAGWEVTCLRSHHSAYALLGEWKGEGEPLWPKIDREASDGVELKKADHWGPPLTDT